jgi:hypothetical protein
MPALSASSVILTGVSHRDTRVSADDAANDDLRRPIAGPREGVVLSLFTAVTFAEPVELLLLLGVKAVVESDQLRILRFQGRKPGFDEGLTEIETGLERRQVRLAGAESGLRISSDCLRASWNSLKAAFRASLRSRYSAIRSAISGWCDGPPRSAQRRSNGAWRGRPWATAT